MSENKAAIENELLEIVRGFKGADFVEPKGPAASAHLFEDLGLDSLDLINLLFQLEEKHGVKISADDVQQRNLLVLGNLAAFVTGQKG